MKIALVTRDFPPSFGGGIATCFGTLAEAMAAAGNEVHVVTRHELGGRLSYERSGRITIHRLPTLQGEISWARQLLHFSAEAARLVAGLHRAGRVEVAEYPDTEAPAIAAMFTRSARPSAVPIVVSLHGSSELIFGLSSLEMSRESPETWLFLAERACLLGADLLIAPSEYYARASERLLDLPRRVEVALNPVRIHASEPGAVATKTVLFTGRLEPQKGVVELVQAWIRLQTVGTDWSLRLAGRDTRTAPGRRPMRWFLGQMLHEHSVRGVEFLGSLPPERLQREIDDAAIVVVPSLRETFGYACAEAMARARPVVASDQGGMAEMLASTEAGLICRAGDASDLAQKLAVLMSESPEQLTQRGALGRDRIAALCNPAAVAQRRIELYQRAIAAHDSRRPTARGAMLDMWRRTAASITRCDVALQTALPGRREAA